jgi:hypothetical protein
MYGFRSDVMNRPRFLASLLVSLSFSVPGLALAQDLQAAKTANKNVERADAKVELKLTKIRTKPEAGQSPVDDALMRALEEEYGESSELRGPVAPSRRRNLNDSDVIIVDDESPEMEWTNLRFGVSIWFASLGDDTSIGSRLDNVSNTFDLDTDVADFDDNEDNHATLVYELEIGLHPVISLASLYYSTELESSQTLANKNIVFKDRGFAIGDTLKTEVTITTFEGALAIHAVKLRWFKLDIYFGAKYMKTELEMSRPTDTKPARERFEMLSPLVGIGVTVRPAKWFEVFATVKIGALEYDGSSDDPDPSQAPREVDERHLSFITLNFGSRFRFGDSFGVGLGVRIESFEQERFFGSSGGNIIEGALGGPYANIFLEF